MAKSGASTQPATPQSLRAKLRANAAWLEQAFWAGGHISHLLRERARCVDQVLQEAWRQQDWPREHPPCLVAVGGYGRAELHPGSDVDLLILAPDQEAQALPSASIQSFLALLWDLDLPVGHSVRTVRQCGEDAAADLVFTTNLMAARLLAGPAAQYHEARLLTSAHRVWPAAQFFEAKRAEQEARHQKYGDTHHNLEPDLKNSPGGLRDLHTITWIMQRHFGDFAWRTLVARGFLQEEEVSTLAQGRRYLWEVRCALHLITGRGEERLLFEHQRTLARRFGFRPRHGNPAVEQFMQPYYRWTWHIRELNGMLMQYFDESILQACRPQQTLPLNHRFHTNNDYLECAHPGVFQAHPAALLEVFLLLGQRRHVKGIRAATMRLIRSHLPLIDSAFRERRECQRLFLGILGCGDHTARALHWMHRCGVLGRYLPDFAAITGKMQHDLFHIYTVDAHTLQVIENMCRFWRTESRTLFPVAGHIFKQLPKPELLYLAGLFHDIAKGRGGDHSLLGAQCVQDFAQRHNLPSHDTALLAWLVENHLLMSETVRRQDINDPQVIRDFAHQLRDSLQLDYLYTLTVADIHATNPRLWNSWKAALLHHLYVETRRSLRHGAREERSRSAWIREKRNAARRRLYAQQAPMEEIQRLWDEMEPEYFLRERVADVVWHTRAILATRGAAEPCVVVRNPPGRRGLERATSILIYAPDDPLLFAISVALLERLDLSVQEARIYTGKGRSLQHFLALDRQGQPVGDEAAREEIAAQLRGLLRPPLKAPAARSYRTPRRIRYFSRATRILLSNTLQPGYTVVEVITPDRLGLLARIGRIFLRHKVQLRRAQISTLGENVDDVFLITDAHHQPITDSARCDQLSDELRRALDADAPKQAPSAGKEPAGADPQAPETPQAPQAGAAA